MSRSANGITVSKGRRPQQLTIAVSRLKIRLQSIAGLRAYQARRSKPLVCTQHTLIFHITTTTGVHTTHTNLPHNNFHWCAHNTLIFLIKTSTGVHTTHTNLPLNFHESTIFYFSSALFMFFLRRALQYNYTIQTNETHIS